MLPAAFVTILSFLLDFTNSSPVYNMQPAFITGQTGSSNGRNIRNLPCISRKNNGLSGVCMFAIDCLKANGTHLGTCIDRFYFGSCCHIEPVKELENSIETNFILDSREPPERIHNTTSALIASKPVETESTTKKPSSTTLSTTEKASSITTTSSMTTSSAILTTTIEPFSTTSIQVTTVDQKLQTFQIVGDSSPTTSATSQKPETTTKAPTKLPTTSKPKPVVSTTTKKPFKPSSTTSKPSSITKTTPKPVRATNATTKKPYSTTRKPYTTTKRVYTTTKKTTTKKPQTSKPTKRYTKPPAQNTTTGKPPVTTKKPVKATTSRPTSILTKKPIISTTSSPSTTPTTVSTTSTTPTPALLSSTTPEIFTEASKNNITHLESSSTVSPTSNVTTESTSLPVNTTSLKPVEATTTSTTTKTTETTIAVTSSTTTSTTTTTARPSSTTSSSTTEAASTSTTESLGLITWTVEDVRVNASTTSRPEVALVGNVTDEWVPITTPNGWILLPSVSTTEQPKNESVSSTSSPASSTESSSSVTPGLTDISLTTTSQVTSSSTKAPTSSSTVTGLENVTTNSITEGMVTSTSSSVATSTEEVTLKPVNMTDFTDVCGRRMWPEARIVGGEKSSFGQWPWQISLRQWRTSTYLHKCGAALLNENWAITAAHCVDNVPPSDLLLRLGEHDLSTETEPYLHEERRVQIVASHPNFDPRTFEYDLALLRFYEPVQFQPNIIPICVPTTDENFVGRTAHVTGWGRLYEDGPLPSVLQEVSVPVINNSVCETMYRSAGYIEHIPNIFICAGWRKGGFDSCEGDSGGPMVIQREDKRFLLAGIISWGIGCAEPNQPGVYTRISEFRVWINKILQF